jgi:hypothetical protein
MRPLTVVGRRASARLANMHEALPVFLALALLNMIVGTAAGIAITGATISSSRAGLRRGLHGGHSRGAHARLGGGWVGLVLMIAAAARQDLSPRKRKAPGPFGPEASLPLATLDADQAAGLLHLLAQQLAVFLHLLGVERTDLV